MSSGALFEYYWRAKGAAAPFVAPVEVFGPTSSKFTTTNRVLFAFITAGQSSEDRYRAGQVGTLHPDTDATLAGTGGTIVLNRMRIQSGGAILLFNRTGGGAWSNYFEGAGIYTSARVVLTTATDAKTFTIEDNLSDAGSGFMRLNIPTGSRTFINSIVNGVKFGIEIFSV